jgi:hypothetical protein
LWVPITGGESAIFWRLGSGSVAAVVDMNWSEERM